MPTGKDLTKPSSPTPATIDRGAIQAENRQLARDLWQGKLSKNEQHAINNLAIQYGLDPLQKQLLCLGGNFYVTVAGLKVIADNSDAPPDAIQLIPATMQERIDAGITANDPAKPDFTHVWKAVLFKRGSQIPYVEFGEAAASDVGIRGQGGGNAKPKDVRAVARTRATGRVLRNAYSIGLPLAEDAPVEITAIEAEIVPQATNAPGPDIAPEPKPDNNAKPATKPQLSKIHILKKTAVENGAIDELDYYKVLNTTYKVEHSNELTLEQASEFIDKLDKKIAENEPPEPEEQDVEGATRAIFD